MHSSSSSTLDSDGAFDRFLSQMARIAPSVDDAVRLMDGLKRENTLLKKIVALGPEALEALLKTTSDAPSRPTRVIDVAALALAFAPFATFARDNVEPAEDDGRNQWADGSCHNGRIVDWFGPTDFGRIEAALLRLGIRLGEDGTPVSLSEEALVIHDRPWPSVAEGWRVVPESPTNEMIEELADGTTCIEDAIIMLDRYRAMLNVTPPAPQPEQAGYRYRLTRGFPGAGAGAGEWFSVNDISFVEDAILRDPGMVEAQTLHATPLRLDGSAPMNSTQTIEERAASITEKTLARRLVDERAVEAAVASLAASGIELDAAVVRDALVAAFASKIVQTLGGDAGDCRDIEQIKADNALLRHQANESWQMNVAYASERIPEFVVELARERDILQRKAAALEAAMVTVRDIAYGRDHLDGFPRDKDEKQRRLAAIYEAAYLAIDESKVTK